MAGPRRAWLPQPRGGCRTDSARPRQAARPAPLAAEAIAKMTVPEGFSVELVASEPDLVNPVAMTFDERGRIWVTESLEYPRHESGARARSGQDPGRYRRRRPRRQVHRSLPTD